MDDLQTIIQTFTEDDYREFAFFIQRHKKKVVRKDYELFKLLLLKKKLTAPELIHRLYPEKENPVAYYALRKRLMQQLTDYIVLKRMAEDPTAASTIMGLLSLAQYLFNAGAEKLAWNILRKAERIAQHNDQFNLLNSVYLLQIEKADSLTADELEEIIRKHRANKSIADEDERATIASGLISKRLSQARLEGRFLSLDTTIQEILHTYGLAQAISQRPALLFRLMQIARSSVLARKDFSSFEPYIIEQYRAAESQYGFSNAQQYYKISLLYMIAHVLYRNRKFVASNQYLSQLHAALQTEARHHLAEYFPKYVFLKAANDAFSRNLPQAIDLLEHLIQSPSIRLAPKDFLTARLGLSFLYFAQDSFQKANNALTNIQKSDKWCEKIMGREWVLKKKLGEMIIQYEFGNVDTALDCLKQIERQYQDILEQPVYKNVSVFLTLLEQLFLQPDVASRKIFLQQVEGGLDFGFADQDDLPSMSFYAWLKSKMVHQKYYEVLLDLADGKPEK